MKSAYRFGANGTTSTLYILTLRVRFTQQIRRRDAVTVTRQPTKCRTKGCPFTPDEHDEWMALCRKAPEHGHRDDQLSHQHHPKKGMGGHNSKSKIVAILCWPMHDRIDNGDWGNAVVTTIEDGKQIEIYRAWDLHNKTIIEQIIGINDAFSDDAEAVVRTPSPDVSA
ncbi:hypothetical protein LCGC14_0981520, partial [marine sediment metagenome]